MEIDAENTVQANQATVKHGDVQSGASEKDEEEDGVTGANKEEAKQVKRTRTVTKMETIKMARGTVAAKATKM